MSERFKTVLAGEINEEGEDESDMQSALADLYKLMK
jgi:hypothetical protein